MNDQNAGTRPPRADGPFGPIVVAGGGSDPSSYQLDVRDPDRALGSDADPLESGAHLEIWVWRLQVWRSCVFVWLGADPHLEVATAQADRLPVGHVDKPLEPSDLFRRPAAELEAMPTDAARAVAVLRRSPGISTQRIRELLEIPIARTWKALAYLREAGLVTVDPPGSNHGPRGGFVYRLTNRPDPPTETRSNE